MAQNDHGVAKCAMGEGRQIENLSAKAKLIMELK